MVGVVGASTFGDDDTMLPTCAPDTTTLRSSGAAPLADTSKPPEDCEEILPADDDEELREDARDDTAPHTKGSPYEVN